MSQKKSRPRINKKAIEGVEVTQPESTTQQEQTEVKIENQRDQWTLDSGEFDWDGYGLSFVATPIVLALLVTT